MAMTLTDTARDRVRELTEARGNASLWLKLSVRGGGCSGFSYVMDFVEAPNDKDKQFSFSDVNVCVDRKSYLFINGIELDYVADLIRQQFVFNNPLAKRSCSCGESFTI